jgi:hypothetical protein
MSKIAAQHSSGRHSWIVDFSFRCKDERQRRAIDSLGLLAHDVIRLWVQTVIPGAIVIEPPGKPVRTAAFLSRAAARRFIAAFGGKLLPAE